MKNTLPSTDAPGILKRDAQAIEDYLQRALLRYREAPPKLLEAVRYSLTAGGKRLRPALVLETFRACRQAASAAGALTDGTSAGIESALAAAGAMELIHTFSLVHDDLPAMDNDDLRRGKPTSHKVFGEAMAILAGDAMMTIAFELLAADADGALLPALVRELASASGPEGMIGGQVLDMLGEQKALSLAELQRLHRCKTGALLTAACRLGAISAGASQAILAAATDFGRHLGLAFQIVDDILDVTSTPQQLGKATGKDEAKGKNTYPRLMGLEAAKREAKRALSAALEALSDLGPAAAGLRALAKFVVERDT